jgi:hypothetical protein
MLNKLLSYDVLAKKGHEKRDAWNWIFQVRKGRGLLSRSLSHLPGAAVARVSQGSPLELTQPDICNCHNMVSFSCTFKNCPIDRKNAENFRLKRPYSLIIEKMYFHINTVICIGFKYWVKEQYVRQPWQKNLLSTYPLGVIKYSFHSSFSK